MKPSSLKCVAKQRICGSEDFQNKLPKKHPELSVELKHLAEVARRFAEKMNYFTHGPALSEGPMVGPADPVDPRARPAVSPLSGPRVRF